MPIMQSPTYHGYDSTDYYTVEEDYGTSEDFKKLIEEAHKRGIRVIVDLMLNHTSSEHPWFVSANSSPESEKREWYIWSPDNPGDQAPWGGPVWHQGDDAYYFGLFWEGMPDLNYRNGEVTAEMQRAARFWLEEMGADGFRLDAVRHLIEDGKQMADTEETHTWLTGFDDLMDEVGADVLTVGEVWDDTNVAAPYVHNDEVDLVFEFNLAEAIIRSINSQSPSLLNRQVQKVLKSYPPGQFATFLTNHDQNRIMTQLGKDPERARLAATLLLTLPGVPFIYYGEEIGMTGAKPDEMIRTPMQWSSEANAGFTTGKPWERVNPGWEKTNVASMSADPTSLLNHYRKLIHLRNEEPALHTGALLPLQSTCKTTYAFLRPAPTEDGDSILAVFNFAAQAQQGCAFSLAESNLTPGTYAATEMLNGQEWVSLSVEADGRIEAYRPVETLEPRGSYVLRLEKQ